MGQVESLHPPLSEDERLAVLGEPTVDALVAKIVSGKCNSQFVGSVILMVSSDQNVVVMAGAGISVAAGIPDFRYVRIDLVLNHCSYSLLQNSWDGSLR